MWGVVQLQFYNIREHLKERSSLVFHQQHMKCLNSSHSLLKSPWNRAVHCNSWLELDNDAEVRAAKSYLDLLILANVWRLEQWLSYQYLQGSHWQDQVRGSWPPVEATLCCWNYSTKIQVYTKSHTYSIFIILNYSPFFEPPFPRRVGIQYLPYWREFLPRVLWSIRRHKTCEHIM